MVPGQAVPAGGTGVETSAGIGVVVAGGVTLLPGATDAFGTVGTVDMGMGTAVAPSGAVLSKLLWI